MLIFVVHLVLVRHGDVLLIVLECGVGGMMIFVIDGHKR